MIKKVYIVDYLLSNLFSVKHACESVGLDVEITTEKEKIEKADGLILPGMGAFGDAMSNLKKLDLVSPLKDFVESGKPFLGVCLGMQLLFSESSEFGKHKGLGLVDGTVLKFPLKFKGHNLRIPSVGWNKIYSNNKNRWKNSLLNGISDGEFMYFVHSYFCEPENKLENLAFTNYEGKVYCSVIEKNNIFATQFHPEKSSKEGIKIYKNFAKMVKGIKNGK